MTFATNNRTVSVETVARRPVHVGSSHVSHAVGPKVVRGVPSLEPGGRRRRGGNSPSGTTVLVEEERLPDPLVSTNSRLVTGVDRKRDSFSTPNPPFSEHVSVSSFPVSEVR